MELIHIPREELQLVTSKSLRLLFALGGTIIGTPSAVWAGQPIQLSDGQLDRVTAGAAAVLGSGIAQATGGLVLTGVNSQAFGTGGATPYPSQPALVDDSAATVVSAVSQGTNTDLQGAPPASSGTSVTTQGAAVGNLVITQSFNATVHGAGGVTAQLGYTVVFGTWYGL